MAGPPVTTQHKLKLRSTAPIHFQVRDGESEGVLQNYCDLSNTKRVIKVRSHEVSETAALSFRPPKI